MSSLKDRIAAQRKAIADRNASFTRAYKFRVGKTQLKILPGVDDAEEFSKEYGAHYIKDPRTQAMIAVVGDAEICYGKVCPVRGAITQFIAKSNERGDDASAEAAKKWLAKPVFVMNAEVMSGDDENKGKIVQPELSSTSYDSVLSILYDLMEQVEGFDIRNGFIINVERVGTGQNDTRYTFTPSLKQPTAPPSKAALDGRVNLRSYVDGKFGAQVNKALTHLSAMLGKDVTATALGAAISESARISGPAADEVGLGSDGAVDAEYTEVQPTTVTEEDAPAAAPAENNLDDILAGLDDL